MGSNPIPGAKVSFCKIVRDRSPVKLASIVETDGRFQSTASSPALKVSTLQRLAKLVVCVESWSGFSVLESPRQV